jgi:subtilase family serine protease
VIRAVAAAVTLAAAVGAWYAGTSAASTRAPAPSCFDEAPVRCFTPQRLRTAYAITPLLRRGIDGRGRTVAIIDGVPTASSTPPITNIHKDLAAFDARYGLAGPQLQVIAPFDRGVNTSLAINEEVIDVEMVHTIAPRAKIVVVLVRPHGSTFAQQFGAFRRALRYAAARAAVVSLSYSWGERCFAPSLRASTHAVLEQARSRHVTMVESSGDYGVIGKPCVINGSQTRFIPVKQTEYPAADPLMLAAGGTRLTARPSGAYQHEVAWNRAAEPHEGPKLAHSEASGGGFSAVFKRPAYQLGVPGTARGRGVPDISADASKTTGLALIKVINGQPVVARASGTSAAAPLWAGLAALADQYAGRRLGFLNPSIYAIARGRSYHRAFHDITGGNNTMVFNRTFTGYRAGPGWDPVTGWGSPNAAALVPLLAGRAGR